MAVADFVGLVGVVAGLLAALHVVVSVGVLVHHAGGVLVRGVLEVPALQDADSGHAQVFDAGVEGQPLVGPRLVLVVVDVGVAGVPAALGEI